MPKVKVRRLEHGHVVTFDEQLWPINVALLVLAGFVAGGIVALSSFDDPRPLYNGWVRLATLGVSVGLLMWAASRLDSHRWRRNMQLATVLSCLFHVLLMVALYNQHLASVARRESENESTVNEPEVTLPDYHVQAPDDPQPDFEKPVEVEKPAEEQPLEVARAESEPQQTPAESQPTPVPGTTPDVQPSTVKMTTLEQAAPRQSEQSSLLSRQTAKMDPLPPQPVAAPDAQATPDQAAKVEASTTPVTRQASEVQSQRELRSDEPVNAPEQQTAQLSRRQTAEPEAQLSSSVASLTRKVNEPAEVPRATAEAPQTAAVVEKTTLEPSLLVARQATAGPQAQMQQSNEPKAAAAAEAAQLDVARTEPSDQPQLASTPQKLPSRSSAETALPATTVADAPQASAAVGDSPTVAPAATAVARSQSAVESPSAAPGAPSAADALPAATVAGATVARVEVAQAPSLNPQAASNPTLARAATTGAVEASPVRVDSPAAAETSSGEQPAAAPAQTALAKGTAGVFGSGQEQNFDTGLTATRQPAPVASMAANRPANLQQGPEGPALAPSAPSAVSKSIAGANIPTAALAADDVPVPDAVGAAKPGQVEASSSAAVRKAEGKGQPSPVSATAGQGQIDLGPTQIVANVGSGRAAGGGAPTVRLNTQAPQLVRSPGGGAPLAALNAPVVAAAPEAPAGDGGGAAAAPAVASGPATAVARAAGGSDLPVSQSAPAAAPVGGGGSAQVTSGPITRAAGGTEAVPGPTLAGGSKLPSRSQGRTLTADTTAAIPQLPSGPAVADNPGRSPGEPGGPAGATRSVAGLPGAPAQGPTGALEAPAGVDTSVVGKPGLGIAAAAPARLGDPTAPTVANIASGGPLRKLNVAGITGGAPADIAAPEVESSPGGQTQPQPSGVVTAGAVGAPGRRGGSLPVQVAALDGPGGLGSQVTPEAGSLSRRAQRDSEVVHAGKERFLARTVGGPLAVDGKAREPARAFSRRGGQRISKSGGPGGQPLERTEESVELGLDFLARHQMADGRWSLNHFGSGPVYEKEQASFHSDTAATGLALLAFLGAGYDHYDDQYQSVVRGGLEFLVRNQKPNGDLYLAADPESNKSAWFYSHGIASIALCEAYGMTGDEQLKQAAQKAIDFIAASQHPTRGGWRYAPQFDADTSVSGWQLMALKSGELSGLKIPPGTYDKVRRWLDNAQAGPSDPGSYVYNPNAPNTVSQRHGRRPTTTMAAVGLLMRLYTGWNRNDPRMVAGAKHLMQHLPAIGTAAQPERDTYYWYYATQVMFHMKGDYWKAWNERLHPLLIERQLHDGPLAGSWDPLGPVPDKWGPHGGRIYVTTLNLLSLEVYYRHLPIYDSEAK